MKITPVIQRAIKCGPIPEMRPIEDIIDDPLTRGEAVISFAANYLIVPNGMKRGEPLIMEPFQAIFILALFDNPHITRTAIMSVAARNGKTFLVAVILLAFLIGPLREKNINIASGAMSRDQAGLCFTLMHKILLESPLVAGLWDAVPSSKKIIGISTNSEYIALSADAKTGYGRDLLVILLDEAQGIAGPTSEFTSMLESRQGSSDNGLFIIVSTQARSDMDYLSMQIDAAERGQDEHTVCHLYAADQDADLMDEEAWAHANPGLGVFRSKLDLEKQMKGGVAITAKEPSCRNQFLNQRISMEVLAFPPSAWKKCAGEINYDLFRNGPVHLGLDLSSRQDMTAAVLTAEDTETGIIHVLPIVWMPTSGVLERERRDRAPYSVWLNEGHLHAIGGAVYDFDQIAESLQQELTDLGIEVTTVQYDKHMIEHFKAACSRVGVLQNAEWVGVPQFFKDMGARLASVSGLMIEGKLRHGGHPVLAMAASVAVAKVGREGVAALAKNLSTQRIDAAVALTMSAWPWGDGREQPVQAFDVRSFVV